MKHSFRIKRKVLKAVFKNELGFNSLTIQNKNDVYNSIITILNFIELESNLKPTYCTYNLINDYVTFQLELLPGHEKKVFFKSIKKFEEVITQQEQPVK
ncbi:hypothetical protein [Hanstruepera marina]|uniref:hypothetical protein n=1 Tax=Hanstruepera marina TaxID=2873265 RepID=UPI001CA699A7|nr:hypothetical protein [Hanstruepera marina]